jgi:hypothetical protein
MLVLLSLLEPLGNIIGELQETFNNLFLFLYIIYNKIELCLRIFRSLTI